MAFEPSPSPGLCLCCRHSCGFNSGVGRSCRDHDQRPVRGLSGHLKAARSGGRTAASQPRDRTRSSHDSGSDAQGIVGPLTPAFQHGAGTACRSLPRPSNHHPPGQTGARLPSGWDTAAAPSRRSRLVSSRGICGSGVRSRPPLASIHGSWSDARRRIDGHSVAALYSGTLEPGGRRRRTGGGIGSGDCRPGLDWHLNPSLLFPSAHLLG